MWTSLAVDRLRLTLNHVESLQGAWVQTLVGELRSCMLQGVAKRNNNNFKK